MSDQIYIDETPVPEIPEDNPESYKTGFAITCFVLAICSALLCCCCVGVALAPISIIFGIIALVKKQGGKGFSIAGLIISGIVLIVAGIMMATFSKFTPDFQYFVEHDTEIIEAYDEDGTIPERYDKYRGSEYDKYWKAVGCKDFDEFFKMFVENYKKNNMGSYSGGADNSGSSADSTEKTSSAETSEEQKAA